MFKEEKDNAIKANVVLFAVVVISNLFLLFSFLRRTLVSTLVLVEVEDIS